MFYKFSDIRKISLLLNARIAYYKQLQQISDTLLVRNKPYVYGNTINEAVTFRNGSTQTQEQKLQIWKKIKRKQSNL
jgi:hypothetical protein